MAGPIPMDTKDKEEALSIVPEISKDIVFKQIP